MDFHTPGITIPSDIAMLAELEAENARLQRLVADLLVRNQQLRVELKAAQPAPGYASNFGEFASN